MPESILTWISISSMVSLALSAIALPIRPVSSQSARTVICLTSLEVVGTQRRVRLQRYLKNVFNGQYSTLADMWVECSCGAKRSMSGATQRDNFDGVACPGHHPFRPNVKNHKCNKPIIPSQRGASNVTSL